MKKGEIYEGVIEKIDFQNKGRVKIKDTTVTVKNGIPGQKVRFMINKKRGGRVEGRLLEVLEKSELEKRDPLCSIFPSCGGCMYQTMLYEEQLKMKEEQIKKLFDDAVDYEYTFEPIKGSPIEFAYRNKMEFSFGDEYKDGPLSLGLHKKGSTYDVLNAEDCKLVHEDMDKILSCVLHYFRERRVSYYHKMQHTGYLRHLLLRRGSKTGEILVNLVTTSQEEYDLDPLKEALLALDLEGSIVGILHIINDSLSDVVKSDETRLLYGQDYFYEELLELRFKITPFSFFQPNSRGAEILYQTVREYIGDTKDKVVFDLYSGTGTIAQIAAAVAKQVIGVEIIPEAVEAAKENAAMNGITNCTFLADDVLKALDYITEKPDLIILDLGLPDIDGQKVLSTVRSWTQTPVIVVSARSHERDKVESLDLGADDYITKPFGTSELLARVRTALRHSQNRADINASGGVFRAGKMRIDYDKRRVTVDGADVHLTQTEYNIVALLSRHAGRVLTYDFVMRETWGPGVTGGSNQILRVNMANIRRKLEKNPAEPEYIFTETGVGYRMLDGEKE